MAERQSGILCHPTSLPGPGPIGDLGEGCRQFLDWLAAAGQRVWQILPLGPTGFGDSPYQPFSAFAGNPLLISLEALAAEGLLERDDLASAPGHDPERIDYGAVIAFKGAALRRSYERFRRGADTALRKEWEAFTREAAPWLEDYSLFMALKERLDWAPWTAWPRDIALREPGALAYWARELAEEVDLRRYQQFLFDRQWRDVRRHAAERGIEILGDMPIFVGHDSADVWAHPDLCYLDAAGQPTVVAGVPPDYFSATGQRWGNPLYRWGRMRAEGYAWWLARLSRALALVDRVRLDHFRGFAGYWEVPAGEETAINGRWVRGPGEAFFRAVEERLGRLPIVAEDLGLISEDVIALREALGLPGMRVLQFAFHGDAANPHLPHNYTRDTVAYTATHDNDTTQGWYAAQGEAVRHRARLYAGSDGRDIHWAFIRLVSNSVADLAIFPLQDALGLGTEARLNTPGAPYGNWTWRARAEALTPELAEGLRAVAEAAGRWVALGVVLEGAQAAVIAYEDRADEE